jgi:hypothetical protein
MTRGYLLIILVVVLVALRIGWQKLRKSRVPAAATAETAKLPSRPKKPLSPWQRKFFTVYIFAWLNTRRYFRDKTAIFFTVAFPLIFLFVFGGFFCSSSGV